jgi:hypothetical protein
MSILGVAAANRSRPKIKISAIQPLFFHVFDRLLFAYRRNGLIYRHLELATSAGQNKNPGAQWPGFLIQWAALHLYGILARSVNGEHGLGPLRLFLEGVLDLPRREQVADFLDDFLSG